MRNFVTPALIGLTVAALLLTATAPMSAESGMQADKETSGVPRREAIHRLLFAIYNRQNNVQGQLEELRMLLQLNPSDATIHYALGCLLMRTGKITEALEEFNHVLEINPNFANAFEKKAACESMLNQNPEVREKWRTNIGDFGPAEGSQCVFDRTSLGHDTSRMRNGSAGRVPSNK